MYMATCNAGKEWDPGKLMPFGDISFSPAAGVLNYGQRVFEGMKAFRTVKDRNVLFRPKKNAVRAAGSAQRVCIPPVPTEMFLDAVKSVVKDNADYIPPFGKGSLYIRPVIWGSGPILGVAPAPSYMFLVYVSPVGPYFKNGVKSLHLKITNQYHRAAPKGTGGHKIVGNYAVSLYPQQLAKKSGFDEAIYLNAADERFIEEVGSANIFILKDDVLTTPSLDGSILPGVTRASVLKIAREKLNLQIRQRNVSVHELLNADEVFCTGTAVVVTPVGMITTNLHSQTINNNEMGPITAQLREILLGIQRETHEDEFNWVCPINE